MGHKVLFFFIFCTSCLLLGDSVEGGRFTTALWSIKEGAGRLRSGGFSSRSFTEPFVPKEERYSWNKGYVPQQKKAVVAPHNLEENELQSQQLTVQAGRRELIFDPFRGLYYFNKKYNEAKKK